MKNDGKKRSKVKVRFWFDKQLTDLLDQVAESYGISRSAFIRLTLRRVLVNRGLLSPETGSLPSVGKEVRS